MKEAQKIFGGLFQQWLDSHPTGEQILAENGFSPSIIEKCRLGVVDDNVFILRGKGISDLNVQELVFRRKMKELISHKTDGSFNFASCEELRNHFSEFVKEMGLRPAGRLMGVAGSPCSMLKAWMDPKKILAGIIIEQMVAALVKFKHNKKSATEVPPNVLTEKIEVPIPAQSTIPSLPKEVARKVIQQTISLLNGQVDIIRTLHITPEEVFEGDRVRIGVSIKEICEMLKIPFTTAWTEHSLQPGKPISQQALRGLTKLGVKEDKTK